MRAQAEKEEFIVEFLLLSDKKLGILKKVTVGILYQLYKLYYLSVACKCYNPNWTCDLVKDI